VLGLVPGQTQPSQKEFDNRVWQALRGFDPARPVFVESESKKVGNVAVPEALILAMRASACIHLELADEERVALLLEDYDWFVQQPEFFCDRLSALTELREEAGVVLHPALGTLRPLGYFLPSQGFTNEHVYLFRAEPVCVVGQPEPEDSEHISAVRPVSAGELRRMIAANEITNALTLALYARMSAQGLI
jgi:hypothetical protein